MPIQSTTFVTRASRLRKTSTNTIKRVFFPYKRCRTSSLRQKKTTAGTERPPIRETSHRDVTGSLVHRQASSPHMFAVSQFQTTYMTLTALCRDRSVSPQHHQSPSTLLVTTLQAFSVAESEHHRHLNPNIYFVFTWEPKCFQQTWRIIGASTFYAAAEALP